MRTSLTSYYHTVASWLPRITLKQAWLNYKNCLKECDWLLLHQIFFCILYFTAFSISTISLHYHKTKLTKRHLASVVKSLENQLIINIPVNLTTTYKVRYKACPEMRVDQEDQNLGNTSQANGLVSRGGQSYLTLESYPFLATLLVTISQ